MFNQAFFIRILIAVLVVIVLIAILPPFFRLIGFPLSADLSLILKLVIAVIAALYVFRPSIPA